MNESELQNLLLIWGKTDPFHPLLFHMVDIGHVGQELINSSVFRPVKRRLLEVINCSEAQLESWIGYLFALHDIGKCHPEFQMKHENSIKNLEEIGLIFPKTSYQKFYHSLYSANWIIDYLKKIDWNSKSIRTISQVFLGHHGKFSQKEILDHPKIHKNWEPLRERINKLIFDYFKPEDWTPDEFSNHSIVGLLFLGLLVLSDWIASNLFLFKYDIINYSKLEDYFLKSKNTAKNTINTLGFNHTVDWTEFKNFKDIYPNFSSLTTIQQMTENTFQNISENKLIIIEALMGDGKTEAALYITSQLLNNWSGIYFALPTTATSNQMYGRVKEYLAINDPTIKESVQLVHGMAWMIDHLSHNNPSLPYRAYEWFKPKKRALLSPFGVGTIDQSLMSVLWVRFGFLRLLGLTGKVLIIDEVHAYDEYMSTILIRLLKWAFILKIPVIILSATLPLSRKNTLLEAYSSNAVSKGTFSKDPLKNSQSYYPLITVKDKKKVEIILPPHSSPIKNLTIILEKGVLEQNQKIAQLALSSAKQDKCVCVIVNTVKNSQVLFQILKMKVSNKMGITIRLFHARFPVERRIEIEKEVLKLFDKEGANLEISHLKNARPKRTILIATQVVEQSLDLDFDEIISEIAPIDLLIQRMGRLHRHYRPHRPCGSKAVFRILIPDLEKEKLKFGLTELVYHRYILLKTLRLLKSKSNKECIINLEFPKDIRNLIDSVYEVDPTKQIKEQDLKEAYEKMVQKLDKEKNQAKIYLIQPPDSKRFNFSQLTKPFEEDDSGAQEFLYAKTRIGDTTRRTILLKDFSFNNLLDRKKPPDTKIQRTLMKRSVSLPKYWFKESQFKFKQVKWLSNSLIIPLEENRFAYKVNKNNKIVKRIIINHPEYGVYIEDC